MESKGKCFTTRKKCKTDFSLDGGQKDENIRSEQYSKLLDLGLVEQVAAKLDTIYSEGLVNVRNHTFFLELLPLIF